MSLATMGFHELPPGNYVGYVLATVGYSLHPLPTAGYCWLLHNHV